MIVTGHEICHIDRCPHGCTSDTGCKGIEERKLEWSEAERIRDLPAVDEAIRALIEDHTGDNATCVVRAVLEAARAASGVEGKTE